MASSSNEAKRGFIPPQTDEERSLCKHVEDLAGFCQNKGIPRQTLFLSDREQALAVSVLNRCGLENFSFDGGYPGAERCILCMAPAGEELPAASLVPCKIETRDMRAKLTHRDFLGAMLALGIKRSCVGDILCTDAAAVTFLTPAAYTLLESQLVEVGRSTVSVAPASEEELPQTQRDETVYTANVAALRADAVLAAMLPGARSLAAQMIEKQLVQINHVLIKSPHATVYAGDVFTVRGKGKFRVCEIGGKSRKDRTFFTYQRY